MIPPKGFFKSQTDPLCGPLLHRGRERLCGDAGHFPPSLGHYRFQHLRPALRDHLLVQDRVRGSLSIRRRGGKVRSRPHKHSGGPPLHAVGHGGELVQQRQEVRDERG